MLALIDSPYNRTTDAIYSVFHHVHEAVPGARFGGAYTFKPGFHSSVDDNLEHWPTNYSVRDAINRQSPRTVGRALDLTLSDAEMRKRTRYLADAADADDPRLSPVREFYGTLNNSTVYGRAHDGPATDWRSSSADSSHLWHIHLSFFTPYSDDWDALAGVVSVLSGESLDDFLGGSMERIIAEYGDTGAWVGVAQRYLKAAGATVDVDDVYGDQTTAAAKWWFVNIAKGDPATYNGRSITSWMLREFINREGASITAKLIADAIAKLPKPTGPTQAQVDAAVAKYLAANPVKLPTGVQVEIGTVSGTLTGPTQ